MKITSYNLHRRLLPGSRPLVLKIQKPLHHRRSLRPYSIRVSLLRPGIARNLIGGSLVRRCPALGCWRPHLRGCRVGLAARSRRRRPWVLKGMPSIPEYRLALSGRQRATATYTSAFQSHNAHRKWDKNTSAKTLLSGRRPPIAPPETDAQTVTYGTCPLRPARDNKSVNPGAEVRPCAIARALPDWRSHL